MRAPLLVACLFSLGIHAGVILLVPASFPRWPAADAPRDVELIEALPSPPSASKDAALPSQTAPSYDATKILPPDAAQIAGAIEKLGAGTATQLPLPPLHLPLTRDLPERALPLAPASPDPTQAAAALLEQAISAAGQARGKDAQIGWGQVRLGPKELPSRPGFSLPSPPVVAAAPPAPAPVPPAPPAPQFGIQGPVAKREPLYQPPLPSVQIQTESEIVLKFWVRPDGVVSRVLPVRKGDANLEAVAMRYLEGWRFTPLPPHEPQVEQWGTITIRFLVPKP